MSNTCYMSSNGSVTCDPSQKASRLLPLAVAATMLCIAPLHPPLSGFDLEKNSLSTVSKVLSSAYDESNLVVFTADYKEAIPLKGKFSYSALRYKGTCLGVTRNAGKLPIHEITESVTNNNLLRSAGKVTTTINNNGRLPIPPIY